MPLPSTGLSQSDLRRRLRSSEPADHSAILDEALPRSGPVPRVGDISKLTPLPGNVPVLGSELEQLRMENAELRGLIEQAIAQEEENEQKARGWLAQLQDREQAIVELQEQVQHLSSTTDSAELMLLLQQRESEVRQLTNQVQEFELQLQYLQESGQSQQFEQYQEAIVQRDLMIESLTARVDQLETHISHIPPPPPTDEELARMADELEKERVQITRLRKELEDERRQHHDDEAEFERQMRDMEVTMSKERAEMARQRNELNRLQAELKSEADSANRGDMALKDKLASFQRQQTATNRGNATAPAASQAEKDSGFMKRFFGQK